jgi:hypothetical protein
VVGPDEIPRVADLDEARRRPELAILSALAHAREGEAFDLALAGFAASDALRAVDEDRATLYHEVIRQSLPARLLHELDRHMQIKGFEFTSEFARKHRAEGVAEGVAKGKAEGKAEAVVAVLEGRGLSISDETRQTLLACRHAETLDRWLAAAGTVGSSDELLQAPNNPDPG